MNGNKLMALVCAASLVALACGDSSGPAVARNDPGTGTRTMKVTADIDGNDVPGGFITDFEVSLRDVQGNPISGATVTVRNSTLGTVGLLEDGIATGDYVATVNTFAPGDYELEVVKDTDNNVQGVVVGGMAVHEIMTPSSNVTVPADLPLTITWSRPSEAAGVDVETLDFEVAGIPDLGTFTIDGANNPARPDQRIRVFRFNRVDIAGGLFGSRLKLEIRNTVQPVLVQ